jgi:hypothetical protein
MELDDAVENPVNTASRLGGEVLQNGPIEFGSPGNMLTRFGGAVYRMIGPTDQELEAAHRQANYYRQLGVQLQQNVDKLQAETEQQSELINRLQRLNHTYDQDRQTLKNAKDELQSECTKLRNHIFSVGTGRAPLQADEYYVRIFEQLKGAIVHEMVELSEQCTDHNLSETAQAKVLEQIAQLGPHGVKSSTCLQSRNSSIALLYGKDELRNSLFRHIAALFLLDKVFEPFAFGISAELSDGLKAIEMDLFEHGLSFY